MAVYQIVWKFRAPTGEEWTETYYANYSTAVSASNPEGKLFAARNSLLHPLYSIPWIEARNVANNRDVFRTYIALKGTYPKVNAGPGTMGQAVVFEMGTAGTHKRRLWMRGCADDAFIRRADTGLPEPDNVWLKCVEKWQKALKEIGYGILPQANPDPANPLSLKTNISSVDGSRKDGTADVKLVVARAYPFPGRVIIGGANRKDLPSLNGTWSLIKAPVGDLLTIPYQTPNGSVVTGLVGHARQLIVAAFEVFDPDKIKLHHLGTRDTKNADTRSRGSKRAVKLRGSL